MKDRTFLGPEVPRIVPRWQYNIVGTVQRMTNVFMELFNGNSNTDRDAVKKVLFGK